MGIIATEMKPSRLIPQFKPSVWNTTLLGQQEHSLHFVGGPLTGIREQRERCSEDTAHEHVRRECTRRHHEVGVDQIIDSALEDGEESKTKAGSAHAETVA